jgi:NAD(P)-dependent dehydrogenase (short-subunit alcohol dehydrogenase family)
VIDTDRTAGALSDPERRARIASRVPLERVGVPEDCVAGTLLLCSDAGSYITGIDLPIDGGLRLP